MRHLLKRHPFPVVAHFDFTLALTYSAPATALKKFLYPGLELDTYETDTAFLAIALVQTRQLRPAGFPPVLGQNFFLTGYRLFVRYRTPQGRLLRGLQVLRSDTNRRQLCSLGNLMTHYHYHLADIETQRTGPELGVSVRTQDGQADLKIHADLSTSRLPEGSVFPDEKSARRFAGPMPFTFSYEKESHSIVRIEGVRSHWKPKVVDVQMQEAGFLSHLGLQSYAKPANAFYVEDIPYRWEKGVVEKLPRRSLSRSVFQGVGNIARFNWPAYAGATGAIAAGTAVALHRKAPLWLRILGAGMAAGAGFQTVASLGASHWIYDRSRLYDLSWLADLWPLSPHRILNVHAGFDETTTRLRELYPTAKVRILDFFDPLRNPEPSISRARRLYPPLRETKRVGASGWPVSNAEADAVLVFLAAHEMRSPQNRAELFMELKRVTSPQGKIVIVEHLRNVANFAAFGPGFMHFLPRSVWVEETKSHLRLLVEKQHTPFLRIFCYERT